MYVTVIEAALAIISIIPIVAYLSLESSDVQCITAKWVKFIKLFHWNKTRIRDKHEQVAFLGWFLKAQGRIPKKITVKNFRTLSVHKRDPSLLLVDSGGILTLRPTFVEGDFSRFS